MLSKKLLIGNELMKEIISIRVDTLWKMLDFRKQGRLPRIEDEGATGKLDNKGAIFIPGGLIYADIDENPITYDHYGKIGPEEFRKKVRTAMKYDNAILLYPDGMAVGVSLDSGFFSKAAIQIFTQKRAAMRRKKKFAGKLPIELGSNDITRSHCPNYVKEPYGARTRLSSCISVGLIDPPMYYAHCKTEFRLKGEQKREFCKNLDSSQAPITGKDGTVLAPPYVVVCHDTRYKENTLTGITRILGLGKIGEFATFTLEELTRDLLQEIKAKRIEYGPDEIFAEYEDTKVMGVLRIYSPTKLGKRSPRANTMLISPRKDLGLDLEQITKEARKRYNISL